MRGIVIAKCCKVYSCFEKVYQKKSGQNCTGPSLVVTTSENNVGIQSLTNFNK